MNDVKFCIPNIVFSDKSIIKDVACKGHDPAFQMLEMFLKIAS